MRTPGVLKSFRNLNLNRIITVYVVFVIVPILVLSSIGTYSVIKNNRNAERETAMELMNSIFIVTETNMNNIVNISTTLCYDTEFMDFLSRDYTRESYLTYSCSILPRIKMTQNVSGSIISGITVYLKNETIPEGYDIFEHISGNEKAGFFENKVDPLRGRWVVYEGEGKESLYYVQGVYNYYGNQLLAIVAIEISIDMFIPITAQDNVDIWIADDKVIYSTTSEPMPLTNEEIQREECVYYNEAFSPLDLNILLKLPRENAGNYLAYYVVLLLLFIVISVTIFCVILKHIIDDVDELATEIITTVDNDFNGQISEQSRIELSVIAEKFNQTMGKIRLLIDNMVEKRIAQREAQITALQCQINPHMLCNSLQIIQYKLELNGQYETSEMVASLGKIMRYGMAVTSISTTVAKEVEHLHAYIDFQKCRFGKGELEVGWQVDKDVKECKMIKLTIQPIVENAIVHAKLRGKPIFISVKISSTDNNVRFEIMNTGKKLSSEEMRSIKQMIEDNTSETMQSIGLRNINRRLTLFYSEESALEIFTDEEGNTVIAFVIPKEL